MRKILIVFGTRPEAIKLAPLVQKLKAESLKLKATICVTAQHREMLDQVLNLFEITPNYDLNIMTNNQDLFDVTIRSLQRLKKVLEKERPDLVIVQGDTTTSFVASLASYYMQIPVAHVEAGLRTYNKYNPFPEEKNRHLTGVLADYHFAPTEWAKNNLLKENIPEEKIWVTGNTVIDALLTVVRSQKSVARQKGLNKYFREKWNLTLPTDSGTNTNNSKLILVTGHRRESFGGGFKNICLALREIAQNNPNVTIVYPVHLNPNVQKPVYEILGPTQTNRKDQIKKNQKNLFLIDPLDYEPFVYLMSKSYLILTDSGGIQEEAPALGKPVLVMRDTTERPEGVEAGTVRLVGTNKDRIIEETQRLLENPKSYEEMSKAMNPYGDGKATQRIVDILLRELWA